MSSSANKSKRVHSNDGSSKRPPTKRQHRNENEKRRRDLFTQLISNLEEILNVEKASASSEQSSKVPSGSVKLDKASILRETAEYLKKQQNNIIFQTTPASSSKKSRRDEQEFDQIGERMENSWKPSSEILTVEEWIQIAIESLNCFFLVAKSDPHNGQIVHVSSNISSFLDYSQNELLNRSLFELILSRDHDQLRDYLLQDHRVLEKCRLSWRRATADEYEQCTIFGAFRQISRKRENEEKYLMSIVKVNTLDRSLVIKNHQSKNQFSTRLNLQGKFIYIDPKAREYLGYSSYELIGHSHFDFAHPDDLPILVRAHQTWKESGSGRSDSYRFLSKGQQWIFLQTECQVQVNSWTGKAESYLCTSFTLQNPTESIQKAIPPAATASSHLPVLSMETRSPIHPILRSDLLLPNATSDSQITAFLAHLSDEDYRRTIREKLNDRKVAKQAEIRVREEEMNVIEDIIQFIDAFQAKQAMHPTANQPQPDDLDASSSYPRTVSNLFIRSPLVLPMDEYSPHYSPLLARHLFSKDDSLPDTMLTSVYSPSQQHLNEPISSPMTPFSNFSRPSPRTPLQFPLSPSSPFVQLPSPATGNPQSTEHDVQHSIPSQPPPSAESSESSSCSSSSSSRKTNASVEQSSSSKKSSFNRSLPHSLVS